MLRIADPLVAEWMQIAGLGIGYGVACGGHCRLRLDQIVDGARG